MELAIAVDGASSTTTMTVHPATADYTNMMLFGAMVVDGPTMRFVLEPMQRPDDEPYFADLLRVLVNGQTAVCQVLGRTTNTVTMQFCGAQRTLRVQTPVQASLQQHMPPPAPSVASKSVVCPMAGALISVDVEIGQDVLPGDDVAVVEAMKMRNVLKADVAGKVKAVLCAPGDVLRADTVIVEFA